MLFNALHREGNNLAMASGKMVLEAIIEALKRNDCSKKGLAGYADRLYSSFVINDLKKYRRFSNFRSQHKEIYNDLPSWSLLPAGSLLQ